jgi:dihydrofolate reductase
VSATVLYMSMSLDGFIAGPNKGPGNGLGDGGERLHDWLFTSGEPSGPSGIPGRPAGINGEIFDEFMSTGAVVAGRRTFEPAAPASATSGLRDRVAAALRTRSPSQLSR